MEVTVTSKQPTIVLNEMMATGLGTIADPAYMKKEGAKYGTPSGGVMCTGPYTLQRWRSGEDITLKARSDYWDKAAQPRNKEVVFKFVTDSSTLTNALLSGEIDGTFEAPVSGVTQLRNNAKLTFALGNSTQTLNLLPTANPALRNVKLRQAISMSIDRAALAKSVFAGTAEPLKSTSILPIPYAWVHALNAAYKDLPEPKLDLAAAKALVKEAGAPAKPIVLGLQAGDAASLQIANAVIDGGRKIGLKMRTKQFPAAQFIGLFFDPKARKAIDLMLTTGYSDLADPVEYFELVALKESVQNFTNYDDPQARKLILEARGETDVDKRVELVKQASKRTDAALNIIPLLFLPERRP